jgi:hypothetical protein
MAKKKIVVENVVLDELPQEVSEQVENGEVEQVCANCDNSGQKCSGCGCNG